VLNVQARIWWVVIMAVLVMGIANLASTYIYVQQFKSEQQRQGEIAVQRICTTLGELAALKPPVGDAKSNPSRAYEQKLHATLDGLAPDLGCQPFSHHSGS
jgi:hypothetical protein